MTKSADLPPPPDDYYLEIEAHFAHRRGTPSVFSARDWGLIRDWKEAGIPLPVVLEAIDQCFDKRQEASRRRTISSLAYCRHAVAELWDERRDLQVGAEGTIPEMSAAEGVESLAKALNARADEIEQDEIRERLVAAASEVGELGRKSIPEIENALIEIEERLYEDIGNLLDGPVRKAIEERLESSLRDVEFRDEATRSRTRAANRRRMIRNELVLPRLSLFG